MSITVPSRLHRHPSPGGRNGDGADSPEGPPSGDPAAQPGGGQLRIGRVGLGSAAAYLLLWTAVVFAVEVLVFWGGHTALHRLGVLDSVSRAAATVLGDPVPESGVLPALEFAALLPWVLLAAGALAVLWLFASLSLVLLHNCICAITGGPRVQVR